MSSASADQFSEVEELDRMVRRADGFRLGFVIANHPLLVDRLTDELAKRWPGTVATVSIDDPGASVVSELEQAARGEPDAIFVRGLERLRRAAWGMPSILELNVKPGPAGVDRSGAGRLLGPGVPDSPRRRRGP